MNAFGCFWLRIEAYFRGVSHLVANAGRAVIREPLVKGMEMAKVIVINAIETAHVFLTP